MITSLFAFRARDVARLAAYFLVRTPGVAARQRAACWSWRPASWCSRRRRCSPLLGSVLVLALLLSSRPMIARIREEFTA